MFYSEIWRSLEVLLDLPRKCIMQKRNEQEKLLLPLSDSPTLVRCAVGIRELDSTSILLYLEKCQKNIFNWKSNYKHTASNLSSLQNFSTSLVPYLVIIICWPFVRHQRLSHKKRFANNLARTSDILILPLSFSWSDMVFPFMEVAA